MSKNPDKRAPETIDGATGKVEGTPHRRIDLSTLRDVRLELAAVYREMDAGMLKSQEGTRRAYVLKLIADVLALSELERRIVELEEKQGLPSRALGYRPGQAMN